MLYLVCFSRYFPDRKYGCFGADDFIHATINIDLGVKIIIIIEINAASGQNITLFIEKSWKVIDNFFSRMWPQCHFKRSCIFQAQAPYLSFRTC